MTRSPRPPRPPATDPRAAAALALAEAARRMPRLGAVELDDAGLGPADRRLASAIVRHGVQRWPTLEALLDRAAGRATARFEPTLRGVLLASAAQLVFMNRVPAYAAVDRGVELARTLVRPGAAKLANAVLRGLDRLIAERLDHEADASADAVPLLGGAVRLSEPALPAPEDRRAYLSSAWGVPRRLVDRWAEQAGLDTAEAWCRCAARTPPVLVAVGKDAIDGEPALSPHDDAGFAAWDPTDDAADGLDALLARHPAWRVQDPTAAGAVALAEGLAGVERVLDYCAGRGTKTRQLAAMFPGAEVVATDTHAGRRRDLRAAFAGHDRVAVVAPEDALGRGYDLILLDVPCSNTGVLARRPEARYRYSAKDLVELTAIQRSILDTTALSLRRGGAILYSTCSVEPRENGGLVERFVEARGFAIVDQRDTPPAGETAASYRDGGFAALMRLR